MDQRVVEQDDMLPDLVVDAVPFAPETPRDLRAVGRLVLDLLAGRRVDLVPDVVAQKCAHVFVVGMPHHKTVVDLAVGAEVDFHLAHRHREAFDRKVRVAAVDPQAGAGDDEVGIE